MAHAKGDIQIGKDATAAGLLPAGIDGTVLASDSVETLGVKWLSLSNTFVAVGDDGIDSSLLTVGEYVPHRSLINVHSSEASLVTSQRLHLTYFTAKRTETSSALEIATGGTAAAATPTLIRLGVYSIAANGDGTLVASTPNDTTLLAATFTAYSKAFSVALSKTLGQRYALGLLVVTAAAAPTLMAVAQPATTLMSNVLALAPRLVGTLAAQADLPSTFTNASLGVDRNRIAYRLVA